MAAEPGCVLHATLAEDLAQQLDQTVGVQTGLADLSPAGNATEHGTFGQARNLQPVAHRFDRAQTRQGRYRKRGALIFPVAFRTRQMDCHADAGLLGHVLDFEAHQLVAAERTPEPEQQQSEIASEPAFLSDVSGRTRLGALIRQRSDDGSQFLNLQGCRLLFACAVDGTYAAHRSTNQVVTRRILEAMFSVPPAECSEALPKGVVREFLRMVGDVSRNRVRTRRQVATPFFFEMSRRRRVSASRIFAGCGLQISIEIR